MSEKNTKIKSRKDILTPFLITIIVSTILYFGLKTLEPVFVNNTLYPSFGELMEGYGAKNPLSML